MLNSFSFEQRLKKSAVTRSAILGGSDHMDGRSNRGTEDLEH